MDFLCGMPRGFRELSLVYVTEELAACAFPATPLAARDRQEVELIVDGAPVRVWVAGIGAFVALKVDALRIRGQARDAYDIVWILRAWDGGPEAAAQAVSVSSIASDPAWTGRVEILHSLFETPESLGSTRYADFFAASGDEPTMRAAEASVTVQTFVTSLK